MHNKFVKKLLKVEKKDSRTLSKDTVDAFSLLHLKWFFYLRLSSFSLEKYQLKVNSKDNATMSMDFVLVTLLLTLSWNLPNRKKFIKIT